LFGLSVCQICQCAADLEGRHNTMFETGTNVKKVPLMSHLFKTAVRAYLQATLINLAYIVGKVSLQLNVLRSSLVLKPYIAFHPWVSALWRSLTTVRSRV